MHSPIAYRRPAEDRRKATLYCPDCGGGRYWLSGKTCHWYCERCAPPAPGEKPLAHADTDHPAPPAAIVTYRNPRPYRPRRAR